MIFHHVGIAVASIEEAAPWWTDVCGFFEATRVIHDPLQQVSVQFFENADGFRIELVEPDHAKSPAARFVGTQGGGMYHICYEVDDLESIMSDWRHKGAFPLGKPMPAVAFNGRRIVFMITPQRQIVEFVEAGRDAA